MALVIENGSLVTGANSYVDVAAVRAYAGARAASIPADDEAGDTAIEAACIKAMDYLEGIRDQYRGAKVSAIQALQFPRVGIVVDGFPVASTEIPQILKDAQCQIAIEVAAGLDLSPTGSGREVRKEVVGPIATEYGPGGNAPQPVLVKANAFLAPLLKSSGGGLRAVRI